MEVPGSITFYGLDLEYKNLLEKLKNGTLTEQDISDFYEGVKLCVSSLDTDAARLRSLTTKKSDRDRFSLLP